MPKITSTPTASSERTSLCAPVIPVAGSRAGTVRTVVSTPAREAAASRVACSLWGGVMSAFSWPGGGAGGAAQGRATKTPSCHRHGGVSASVGATDALDDYEDERASAKHRNTLRPHARTRQPRHPTVWTSVSIPAPQPQMAPCAAEPTSLAYFPRTP